MNEQAKQAIRDMRDGLEKTSHAYTKFLLNRDAFMSMEPEEMKAVGIAAKHFHNADRKLRKL